MDARILDYWEAFLRQREDGAELRARGFVAERFGDSAQMADDLGGLIVTGAKTATCACVWEFEHGNEPVPCEALITIVLDGAGAPLCIVETTRVDTMPYKDVTAEFAHAEGEGDRSLEYWREAHWQYFSRALPKIGREPTPEMPLVCERFRVLHR